MAERTRITVKRADLARIMREGAEAAEREGAKATDCPYSPTGDADERLRVAAWMRAFTRRRNELARG